MHQLLLMVLIFLVFGILGALFFSHVITHPIRSISEIAEGIDLDALRYKKHPRVRIREKLFGKFPMVFRATDELDVLTEKFNAMIERLENAHQELEAAYAQLVQSEKLASLGTLSAGLAHEINNPIAGIQNCLRRLKQNPQNVAQAKKYLELMEEATNRIATVVRSLLDYARPREMDFAPVNIEEVIETALLLVLEKHRISITKEVPANVPPIHASRHHLEQVMVNLLLNAIDAIEERFLQSQTASKSIHIGVRQKRNSLEISLKDSGIGIPQENLTKIFDPFYTTKEIGKGTGMGLSVCYNIIKLNQGTTFYIVLPLASQSSKREEKSLRGQKVIFVVEDEHILRVSLVDDLSDAGYQAIGFADGNEAWRALQKQPADVVLTDIKMPGMDGMELLDRIKSKFPHVTVIIMTAYGSVDSAVEAMKKGAYDYLTKPFHSDELLLILQRIQELESIKSENIQLKKQLSGHYPIEAFVGNSHAARQIKEMIRTVAASDASVLITGETGTGKELVANIIHYNSPRKDKPLVKVSCAILARDVFESELFGHEKGAFTGAIKERIGRFEQANGGTIYLDDVDDIPLELQVKLLRVLQEKEVERVGSNQPIPVDVRVIASTKADLRKLIQEGKFREDLY